MFTIANPFAVPIEQNLSVNCFSSIERKLVYFISFFAKTDTKYSFLGTPFFRKYIQKIRFHGITLVFRLSVGDDQPTIVSFTTLVEKNFPSFLLLIKILLKSRSS